jgi:hypothetical protein
MTDAASPRPTRIGFLGPAEGDLARLERAASFLLTREHVVRAVYLGGDGALDRCVVAWAKRLVGEDPTDEGAWRRAAEVSVSGSPEQIDRFVAGERERLRLRALATLPEDAPYAFETVGDLVVLVTFDLSVLTEEDLAPAHVVVVGDTPAPSLEERGTRWVLELGPLGPGGGVAVLDAHEDTGVVTVYDDREREILRGEITPPRTARLEIVSEVGPRPKGTA